MWAISVGWPLRPHKTDQSEVYSPLPPPPNVATQRAYRGKRSVI